MSVIGITIEYLKTLRNTFFSIKERYFDNQRSKLGYRGKNVQIALPSIIKGIENVYMYDNTNIFKNAMIIAYGAKFIMKKNSGAAENLIAVTNNHTNKIGYYFKEIMNKFDDSKDIIIDEDVWIAANVTLLSGVTVGRGAIIGAGSVCRNNVPPYAIVVGNPAKIVGFKFTPEEVIKHEKILYNEHERIDIQLLEKNYNKYFINRINEIKSFLKQ